MRYLILVFFVFSNALADGDVTETLLSKETDTTSWKVYKEHTKRIGDTLLFKDKSNEVFYKYAYNDGISSLVSHKVIQFQNDDSKQYLFTIWSSGAFFSAFALIDPSRKKVISEKLAYGDISIKVLENQINVSYFDSEAKEHGSHAKYTRTFLWPKLKQSN